MKKSLLHSPLVVLCCALLGLAALIAPLSSAWAWGQEGHSVVAEIAQRRLSPRAAAAVERVLGRGHSLASVASWADNIREVRPETYNWHFVSIPRAADTYDVARDCADNPRGDCVVQEIERLRHEVRCAESDEQKLDALRYAVHFIGDIHQPLHALGDERGGNGVMVKVEWHGLTCTGKCVPRKIDTNLHSVWDTNLITSTVWSWGTYVDILEEGWLKTPEAQGVDGGSPADWANAAHVLGQQAWDRVPADHVLGDDYFQQSRPVVDRQLALAGLRLARFLNETYASRRCTAR